MTGVPTPPAGTTDRLDGLGFLLVAGSLGFALGSIAISQSLLALAVLVWIAAVIRDRRRADVPPFFLPLVVYALATLASAAMSLDPAASFWDSRQLLLLLVVPVTARFARGARAMTALDVIIAIGAASAVWGVVQYNIFGFDDLAARPSGSLGHYMTYSGVVMLVLTVTVARLAFHGREWIWPAIALPALVVALGVTQARNAWIGAAMAVTTIFALWRPRLIWIVPVAAVLMFAVSPAGIRDRALSMFDMNDPTVRDRFAMLKVGAGIVQDYPVFGVGPEMVESVYRDYRPPEGVNEVNPHLHNVPVQIAAERGLLALGVWLWFVVVAMLDLLEQARKGPARALATAGLAAMVAMLGAGLFEYNFGDSEFLMLLLGLITLPYAAARGAASVGASTDAARAS